MATITAAGSGNWNSGVNNAPWPGGTAPGDGDTVVIGAFTVTVPAGFTAQCGGVSNASQDLTTMVLTLSTTTSHLIVNGTLKVYGNMTCNGSGTGGTDIIVGPGGIIRMMSSLNVATPNRYVCALGTSNIMTVAMNGTNWGAGACKWESDSLGVSFWNGANQCKFTATYTELTGASNEAGVDAIAWIGRAMPNPGAIYTFDHVKMNYCGQLTTGALTAGSTSTFSYVTRTNSRDQRYGIIANATTHTVTSDHLSMDDNLSAIDWKGMRITGEAYFSNSQADGAGGVAANVTFTGRYITNVSKGGSGANGAMVSSVQGAIRDVIRVNDGSLRQIVSAETTNMSLTLNRAHTFNDGAEIVVKNYLGTVPTPLVSSPGTTTYFVAVITGQPTVLVLYDSNAHALAAGGALGVALGRITITGTGTGSISVNNPHWGGPGVVGDYYFEDEIFVFDGVADSGDMNNGPTATTVTMTMQNCLACANPDGSSPGVFCAPTVGTVGTSNFSIDSYHNTLIPSVEGLMHAGETYIGHPSMFRNIQSNLIIDKGVSIPSQVLYSHEGVNSAVNALRSAGAHHNWIDGGTNYDAVGECYDLSETTHAVTFTNGSANVGWTAHGMLAGQLMTKITTTGTLPTNFALLTIYQVSATGLSANLFQLEPNGGGTPIVAGSAGSGTHTAHVPQDVPAFTTDLVNTASNCIDTSRSLPAWAAWWGTRIGAAGDSVTTPGTAATLVNALLLMKNAYNGTFADALSGPTQQKACEWIRRGYIPRNVSGRRLGADGLTSGVRGGWLPTCSAASITNTTTGTVTTNVGDGTMYWVITKSATKPDWDRIAAGQDELGVAAFRSGNAAVIATGAQALSWSALTIDGSTYYLHTSHDCSEPSIDQYLRMSDPVSSSGFTPAAATGGGRLSLLGVG